MNKKTIAELFDAMVSSIKTVLRMVMNPGDMNLLVDCGGSSVKISRYVRGILRHTHPYHPKTLGNFYNCLEEMAKDGNPAACPHITGIAISICGEYDYVNEEVVKCWAYPFLEGKLKDKLMGRFQCGKVRIVNDGDAHALALKSVYAQKGVNPVSAINLSLGTSVGFGLLDGSLNLLHANNGHNWEIGDWQCETKATHKDVYWALGSKGLKELEDQHANGSPDAFILYGERLCHFLGEKLAPKFHPKIIGLSGGIVAAHLKDIKEGILRECEERHYRDKGGPLDGVDIYLSPEKDSVMRGLADLLNQNRHPILNAIGNLYNKAMKLLHN